MLRIGEISLFLYKIQLFPHFRDGYYTAKSAEITVYTAEENKLGLNVFPQYTNIFILF